MHQESLRYYVYRFSGTLRETQEMGFVTVVSPNYEKALDLALEFMFNPKRFSATRFSVAGPTRVVHIKTGDKIIKLEDIR